MIRIFSDKTELTHAAAGLIVAQAEQAVRERGQFSLVLSGGSTPQALFSLLARPPVRAKLPWSKIHFFWGDERLVAPDVEGSNYYHAAKLLLEQVPIEAGQIHRMKGELPAEAAAADYRRQLDNFAQDERIWPCFDLVLLGLGSDGHTASLFPGSSAAAETTQPVVAVTADYEGRPAQRLTLTSPVFNDAGHILFLVTGPDKAEAVAAVLEGASAPEKWPAQRIQPAQGDVSWFMDEFAAAKLREFR